MRWDIINFLVDTNEYNDYLEVGVQDYYSCCDKIHTTNKTSVDPAPRNKCDYIMTSDAFFEQLDSSVKYDIVFVDGLHLREVVYRDIINSLDHLKPNGTIVVHDCLPDSEPVQFREDPNGPWMGDVWKAIVDLKANRTDLEIRTVDHDCGCAIVRFGKQELNGADLDNLTWQTFCEYKDKWLGIISYSQFLELYGTKA
jgi:hypothetical protein